MSQAPDTAGAVSAYLNGQGFDLAVPLKQSVLGAVESNPEAEAMLQRAARRTGVDLMAARVAPDEVKRRAAVVAMDLDGMVRDFPQTAAFLANQDRARIAHDDVGALQAVETAIGRAARYVMGADGTGGLPGDLVAGARALASGVPMAGSGVYGAVAAPFGLAVSFSRRPCCRG